jgi:hypothetical protein
MIFSLRLIILWLGKGFFDKSEENTDLKSERLPGDFAYST